MKYLEKTKFNEGDNKGHETLIIILQEVRCTYWIK